MPPVTAQRRPATPLDPIICRTLRREYRIHAPDAEAYRRLSVLQIDPLIADRPLEVVDIAVEPLHGFYRAKLPHGTLVEGSARHLVGMLHGLLLWDLAQSHPEAVLIHGATAVINGRRLVLTGDKGAGKTTLTLHLLAHGHVVEGDEHLVLEPSGVIARPRTLRVKAGSFPLVANLPPAIYDTPTVELWEGDVIHSISPALFGQPWVLRQGPLDGIVFIEPNHGGRSVMFPISTDRAFRLLMQTAQFPKRSALAETVRVRQLAATTPAYVLRIGDLERAEYHLCAISTH